MVIYSGFSHIKWWFSTAMLNYQRVSNAAHASSLRSSGQLAPSTWKQKPASGLKVDPCPRLSQTHWLVVWTPMKHISQLGWLSPIYGTIKNVPNHQREVDPCPLLSQKHIKVGRGWEDPGLRGSPQPAGETSVSAAPAPWRRGGPAMAMFFLRGRVRWWTEIHVTLSESN